MVTCAGVAGARAGGCAGCIRPACHRRCQRRPGNNEWRIRSGHRRCCLDLWLCMFSLRLLIELNLGVAAGIGRCRIRGAWRCSWSLRLCNDLRHHNCIDGDVLICHGFRERCRCIIMCTLSLSLSLSHLVLWHTTQYKSGQPQSRTACMVHMSCSGGSGRSCCPYGRPPRCRTRP